MPCGNDPCGICSKNVDEKDKSISCNKCNKWIHIECNKLALKQYKYYQTNPEIIFEFKTCNKCDICDKIVAKNQHATECNICIKWIHINCNKLSDKEYRMEMITLKILAQVKYF